MLNLRLLKDDIYAYCAMCKTFSAYLAEYGCFTFDSPKRWLDESNSIYMDYWKVRKEIYEYADDIGLVLDEISETDRIVVVDVLHFDFWKELNDYPAAIDFLNAIDPIRYGKRYEK